MSLASFRFPSRWTPLPRTMRFPLSGRARDFHPLDYDHVGRTIKGPVRLGRSLFSFKKKASDDFSTKTSQNIRYFLTSSLLFAIRWRTMIISELRRIIGWFWVAQAKKCILCIMYVRKKHNRYGSTSVVVASKASGKYRVIKSGLSEIWSGA